MAYTDPNFEARRRALTGGGASSSASVSPARGGGGYVDPAFEARRQQILTAPRPVATQPTPQPVAQPQKNFFQRAGEGLKDFNTYRQVASTVVKTGKDAFRAGSEFIQSQDNKKAISPTDVKNTVQGFYDKVKEVIIKENNNYKSKVQEYKKEQNIDQEKNLNFEQIRDFSSTQMLKLAQKDVEEDLKKLQSKQSKSGIDNLRIKNYTSTLKEINDTLTTSPEQRAKKETFITGLALSRGAGDLASGFLGAFEGVANFVKWRGDVAGAQNVSAFGEEGAKRIGSWIDEVRPNNPQLADEIAEGLGSTLAFYIPGAGISNATSRLAVVSPQLASVFGITASATLEAATESGTTYQEVLSQGKTREEADQAANRVFVGNVLFNVVSDKVGIFSDAKGVKQAFVSAFAEGSQEAFQEGLQNVNTNKDITENLEKSFFIGSLVGGGLSTVVQNASQDPDLTPEDRSKLEKFAEELRKAEADEKLADEIAGRKIAGQQPQESQPQAIPRTEPATEAQQQFDASIENYVKDSGVYTSPDGTPQETPALMELSARSKDPEIVQFTQEQVKQIPKNEDGTITLYRGGTQNDAVIQNNPDRLVSAAYDRASAENFVSKNEGDPRTLMEFKVNPEDIAVFIGGSEAEVLVPGSKVVGQQEEAQTETTSEQATTEGETLASYYAKADQDSVQDALWQVTGEMEIAEAGQRLFNEDGEFTGSIASTYPQWVPEELRRKELFAGVLSGLKDLNNIQYPPNSQPRKQALYDAVLEEIDSRAGLDSSTIREQLKQQKESSDRKEAPTKPEAKEESEKADDRSASRGERTKQKQTQKRNTKVEDFPSVASALETKGVEKIDNFELRKAPEEGSDEFKLYTKVTELIRKYAKTIGEDYMPRGSLGVYYQKTENIRVNSMNNVSVAAHEIAHFLDAANNITKGLPANITSQLGDLYVEYYAGAKPTHAQRMKQLEGFATLLQKYTEMPTTITQKYPELVDYFLKPGGGKYVPVVGDILKDLNDIIGEYQGLSALDKIASRVTSQGTKIGKESFLNFWQKVRTQIVDEVYPAEVLAQKAGVSGTKTDPSLWVRAYQSVNGVVANNINTDRGYWSFQNLQDGFQKKYSFNWKTLLDSTQKRGITDSFASYLVARREHFAYQELDALEAKKDQLEKINEAIEGITEENESEFDRDMKAQLSEDFGIDLTELSLDQAKKKVASAFEQAEKDYQDLKEVLDNDAFSRKEIDEAYEQNKEQYKDEEKMFDILSREDLETLHNADIQLIDKEQYTQLKNKEGYASFKRQFYDEIVGDSEQSGSVGVGGTKVSSLIRRKGSEKTIINPLYSALVNHNEVVRKSMKQLVYNQIANIGSSAVLPTLFQEVPLSTAIDEQGRVSYPQEKDPDMIIGRRDYKRVAVLTDREIKATIDNLLTYKNVDVFVQLYTGISRFFTAGTTGFYPQFALTNFMIDQVTATANSYNKYRPLYSPLTALKAAFEKTKGINSPEARFYEEYLVMGGERQTFTGWQKLEPNDLFKRITSEKSKMEKAIGLVNKGTDILSIPAAKSELFSRAAEYINARKAGKSQVQALEEAGRVTAPFHHIGAWGASQGQKGFGQTYIRGLPFFNASLQVLDQTARVASTKSGQQRITFMVLAVTAAYLTSALAMADASDEQKEQYKGLEAADLSNFIYYPDPSGSGLIRVKMSTTFSLPGTLINMVIANKMFSAKYEAKDAMEAATSWLPTQLQFTKPETILSWIPQIFKPAAYTVLNVKDYPTVSSLVNTGLSRKPAPLQYNEGTSVFAKKLGEVMNLSPIKIDYLLTGYFGRASGFLTGRPGIYNPASSIMREYYFTTGRQVRKFYEESDKIAGEYTAYQNWEKGYTNYSKEQVAELYRKKMIADDVDGLLGDYRELDVKKEPEKAAELRGQILVLLDSMQPGGMKPKDLYKWSADAAERRRKAKPKE